MSIEKLQNCTRILLIFFVECYYSRIYKNVENERGTNIRVKPQITWVYRIWGRVPINEYFQNYWIMIRENKFDSEHNFADNLNSIWNSTDFIKQLRSESTSISCAASCTAFSNSVCCRSYPLTRWSDIGRPERIYRSCQIYLYFYIYFFVLDINISVY